MKFWIGNEKGLGQINIYITRVSNGCYGIIAPPLPLPPTPPQTDENGENFKVLSFILRICIFFIFRFGQSLNGIGMLYGEL